jgi:hypothetical protein
MAELTLQLWMTLQQRGTCRQRSRERDGSKCTFHLRYACVAYSGTCTLARCNYGFHGIQQHLVFKRDKHVTETQWTVMYCVVVPLCSLVSFGYALSAVALYARPLPVDHASLFRVACDKLVVGSMKGRPLVTDHSLTRHGPITFMHPVSQSVKFYIRSRLNRH